jgi:hypothetical protein
MSRKTEFGRLRRSMGRKSVMECIEEATRCTREATAAGSEEELRRHLTRAGAWLEIANYRARDTEASALIPETRH